MKKMGGGDRMGRDEFKKGLMLFLFFAKIGCFTFGGGWSILAQMEEEFIRKRQMITQDDLLELTVVGKSVPGIMITNISMLFGYQIAGWFGGVCAVLGITLPAVAVLSVIAVFYTVVKDNFWCHCALLGISSAVVPIIASAAISMGKEALRQRSSMLICAVAFMICVLTDVSNILLVVIGVIAALIWMGVERNGVS